EKGIPIGNYTSQLFANIYLNELDQYVKNDLRIKYYLRYMDDFIVICKTKEEAKEYFNILKKFVEQHLDLQFNKKSKYYPSRLGVDFCGYITYETHRRLRKRSKRNMLKKIKQWNKEYQNNTLDLKIVQESWNSWLGHINHANCYNLMKRYREKFEFQDLIN
ncbi:MAG: RNA-directed DNA polymerase, partial [Bacilli bacterium]|nr:RNA-directed DNA polymerase [Bacilli bacterium]